MPSRDHLVFRALCVLDEAMEATRHGRVPATHGLRLALAYLYAVGDRRSEGFNRGPYDEFWRLATMSDIPVNRGVNVGAAGYGRHVHMIACTNAIARAAGMEMTVEMNQRIGRARAAP